jgi:hypothetical protein
MRQCQVGRDPSEVCDLVWVSGGGGAQQGCIVGLRVATAWVGGWAGEGLCQHAIVVYAN